MEFGILRTLHSIMIKWNLNETFLLRGLFYEVGLLYVLIKMCSSFDTSNQKNSFSSVPNRDVFITMNRLIQYTISELSHIGFFIQILLLERYMNLAH